MPREKYDVVRSFCDHMDGRPAYAATVFELLGSPRGWTRESIAAAALERGVEMTTVRDRPWMVTLKRRRKDG